MSGQPVGDFFLDYFDDPQVDQQQVEQQVGQQLEQQLDTLLADAHTRTGLTQVRDDYGFAGVGQTVAVIDSGIAWDHIALGGGFGESYRVVGGWDFAEGDADPYDDGPSGSHGTHVSGIIGADQGANSGVASEVDLVGLRVFSDAGAGRFSWVESALQWVHTNRSTFANPITTVNLSIGTSWNADTVPAWATLEDEFAQLEADGIFISVAAGNSFTSYNTTGLSYPAASSYVVPVMSVDNNGSLSYFSQRHPRAIAAPGRGITSTVPDYVGNQNGINDDYASYSGTSMAAPYVAGASVLVRQAMELVGRTGITQDTIYDVLRNTADTIYDSATGLNYLSLNLASAIDSIMPSDDYGSTADTAYDLGTLADTTSITGLVGRLDDVDYFSFTAGATGSVTLSAATTDELVAQWVDANGNMLGNPGKDWTFDVVAGQTYTVGLSTADRLGHFTLDALLTPIIIDWGVVDFAQMNNQSQASTDTWYQVEAAHNGLFTVETFFAHASGNVDLELYSAGSQLLAVSHGMADSERVDTTVVAGDILYLRVTGANADIDFRLTNLVAQTGTSVEVNGTAGDDTFTFTAGGTHRVSINGVEYTFDAAAVSDVSFDGGAGNDTATLTGTTGDETAILRAGSVELSGTTYDAHATGIETAIANAGGGNDHARFYDTAGDDAFVGRAEYSTLSGNGYSNRASGFDIVDAYATGGGHDTAQFFDSAGDDTFQGRLSSATLSGSGFSNHATGFDNVYAYSRAGGNDTAQFFDSAGDDSFVATPSHASLQGAGFYNYARGFKDVYAYASAGGYDVAQLYDSAGDDTFVGRLSSAVMRGNQFYNYTRGFDRVYAYASAGGSDTAQFFDSAGNDSFVATPSYASLQGASFYNYARGFTNVYAYASAGGYDVAQIYDSPGDDILEARPGDSFLSGSGFYNYARGFDRVYAYATGGDDEARMYDSAGVDYFYGRSSYSMLIGDNFYNYARGFDRTLASSTAGGSDFAQLFDSTGDDFFEGYEGRGVLHGSGFYNSASGFDRLFAYAGSGGADRSEFFDVAGSDMFAGSGNYARRIGSTFESRAYDFDFVKAHAKLGETAHAEIGAVDYVFEQIGTWN